MPESKITKISITVNEHNNGGFKIDIHTFPKEVKLTSMIDYLHLAINDIMEGSRYNEDDDDE